MPSPLPISLSIQVTMPASSKLGIGHEHTNGDEDQCLGLKQEQKEGSKAQGIDFNEIPDKQVLFIKTHCCELYIQD